MTQKADLIRYYPVYCLFKASVFLLRLLPRRLADAGFLGASYIAYATAAKHRRLALENLDIAFNADKSDAEKRRIARCSFTNLFLTVGEFLRVPSMISNIRSIVSAEGLSVITRALRHNRGVIFLVSHFGNWEIMAHRTAVEGFRIATVGRPLKNPLIYREIERLRGLNGVVTLKKKWVAREIMRKLRDNWCIAILADQYAGRFAPFVPFFGRPVSTSPAVALLAMKTGASVIPVFDVRCPDGLHCMRFCEPVEIAKTGNTKADIAENCARFNRVLEEWVRRFPEQWLWMHRRWRRKKSPEED